MTEVMATLAKTINAIDLIYVPNEVRMPALKLKEHVMGMSQTANLLAPHYRERIDADYQLVVELKDQVGMDDKTMATLMGFLGEVKAFRDMYPAKDLAA